MSFRFQRHLSSAFLLSLLLVGIACRKGGPQRSQPLGVGYAGPASMSLRQEIPLDSPVVTTVQHGEPLQIIRRRRIFLLVRTSKGVEGWTNERLLLSAQEMADLKHLAERAQKLPTQGVASTYELLNVHTDAARSSPSFLQVKPGEKVDVVLHVIAPRTAPPRPPLIPPAPKRVRKSPKKEEGKYPPLARPNPPGPPANWLELSRTSAPGGQPDEEKKPVPMDDWSLIRNRNGQAGWVLTSRLYMAIPDDVAQYAEGRRITSYFPLGEVQDDDQIKHHWLWTTISAGLQTYDFDSFRVFIWNVRRHRYETAYVERNLKGYFPVRVHPVTLALSARVRGTPTTVTYPGFSVCVERENGQRYRRSYAFITNVVRFAGEQPCEISSGLEAGTSAGRAESAAAEERNSQPGRATFLSRLKAGFDERVRKWFK